MDHGSQFNNRIKEILRDRMFEPKHIHLFAGYRKEHVLLIDGSTDEEIQKCQKSQAKREERRVAYGRKLGLYWEIRKQVTEKAKELGYETEIKRLTDKTDMRSYNIDKSIVDLRNASEHLLMFSQESALNVQSVFKE